MMDAVGKLKFQKSKVDSYFQRMARAQSIVLDQVHRSDFEIEMTGRIYEEQKGDRIFYVVVNDVDDGPIADNFRCLIKKVGEKFENALLEVLVNDIEEVEGAAWDAYYKWLHLRLPQRAFINS